MLVFYHHFKSSSCSYLVSLTCLSSVTTPFPCPGAGTKGEFTGEAGLVAYYEICDYIKRGYTVKYHPEHKAMYTYSAKEHNWVGYDNPQTLATKLDYIKSKGLGGAMIWAIDLDDFSG